MRISWWLCNNSEIHLWLWKMRSFSQPDCGYDNSTIILIGVWVIQNVWINFACTEILLNLSAEAISNARNAHLCARCGIFLLKIKQIPFSCRLVKGFTFSKRIQKLIQDDIGDMYCRSEYCLNRQKCKPIGGYVTTPRSVYGYDNSGVW